VCVLAGMEFRSDLGLVLYTIDCGLNANWVNGGESEVKEPVRGFCHPLAQEPWHGMAESHE
jgi:hypothetical protein